MPDLSDPLDRRPLQSHAGGNSRAARPADRRRRGRRGRRALPRPLDADPDHARGAAVLPARAARQPAAAGASRPYPLGAACRAAGPRGDPGARRPDRHAGGRTGRGRAALRAHDPAEGRYGAAVRAVPHDEISRAASSTSRLMSTSPPRPNRVPPRPRHHPPTRRSRSRWRCISRT